MLVGYMRVSSDGDRGTAALQRDALLVAGVDDRHLHEDKASGARADRCSTAAGRAVALRRLWLLTMREAQTQTYADAFLALMVCLGIATALVPLMRKVPGR